jgi:hypothetical protein
VNYTIPIGWGVLALVAILGVAYAPVIAIAMWIDHREKCLRMRLAESDSDAEEPEGGEEL